MDIHYLQCYFVCFSSGTRRIPSAPLCAGAVGEFAPDATHSAHWHLGTLLLKSAGSPGTAALSVLRHPPRKLCSSAGLFSVALVPGCATVFSCWAWLNKAKVSIGWQRMVYCSQTSNKKNLPKPQVSHLYSSETFVKTVPKNGFFILFCYRYKINELQHTSYCKH